MGIRHSNNARTSNLGNTEDFPSFDIRNIRAQGSLVEDQKHAAGIPYEVNPSTGLPETLFFFETDLRPGISPSLTLTYHNWNGQSGKTTINLLSRAAHLGGRRWYFQCPVNGSRCEKLYLISNGWMSRTAAKLAFRTQSEGYWDRLLRRRDKIRQRVKGSQVKRPLRGKKLKAAENYLDAIEANLEGVDDTLGALDAQRKMQRETSKQQSAEEKKELEVIGAPYLWLRTFHFEFKRSLNDLKREAVDASPVPTLSRNRSEPRIVDTHLPCIDLSVLQRLGYTHNGSIRGARIDWTREQTARPYGDLYFAIDLRERDFPCAMMILTDDFGEKITTQLFWLQRATGIEGRYQFRFICPQTDHLSRVLLYKDRRFATAVAIFGDPDELLSGIGAPQFPDLA